MMNDHLNKIENEEKIFGKNYDEILRMDYRTVEGKDILKQSGMSSKDLRNFARKKLKIFENYFKSNNKIEKNEYIIDIINVLDNYNNISKKEIGKYTLETIKNTLNTFEKYKKIKKKKKHLKKKKKKKKKKKFKKKKGLYQFSR